MGKKQAARTTDGPASKRARTEETLEDKVQRIMDTIEQYHTDEFEDIKDVLLILVEQCFKNFKDNRSKYMKEFGDIVLTSLTGYQTKFSEKLAAAKVPVDETQAEVDNLTKLLDDLDQDIMTKHGEIDTCEEWIQKLKGDHKAQSQAFKDIDAKGMKQLAPLTEAEDKLTGARDLLNYLQELMDNKGCSDTQLRKKMGDKIMKWLNAPLKCSGSLLVIASSALCKAEIADFDLKILVEIKDKFEFFVKEKTTEVDALRVENAEMVQQVDEAKVARDEAEKALDDKQADLKCLKTALQTFQADQKKNAADKKKANGKLSPLQTTFEGLESEFKTLTEIVTLASALYHRTEQGQELLDQHEDEGEEIERVEVGGAYEPGQPQYHIMAT